MESFKKFEDELIKVYKKKDIGDDKIKQLVATYKQFCDRVDKSEFRSDIIEWFDNNNNVIKEREKIGIGYLNDRMIRELFNSMKESLKIESDPEFYRFLDIEFGSIMY